jgi:hypothetical protein
MVLGGGGAILIRLSVVRNGRMTFSVSRQIAVVMVIMMLRETAAAGPQLWTDPTTGGVVA